MGIDSRILELTFNHIVFPPKLPGQQDRKIEDVERDLLKRLHTAVRTLKACTDNEFSSLWEGVQESLNTCQLINDGGFVNKTAFNEALHNLKPHNIIIVRVTQQNAGLLIRPLEDEVVFEAFEASPSAEQTLQAKGAMQWDFPTVAVSLPREEFENDTFQQNLSSFLQQASLEVIEEFAAKTRKAGVAIAEARDTVHPTLITDFLMTLLEVNGSCCNTAILRKRIKDDVCWEESELPWRRSPFWLILRVSVQRLLYLTLGEEKGRPQYKFLIAVLLSQLLADCVHSAFNVELCSFLRAKLCRRLSKLESEMKDAEPSAFRTYSDVFAHVGPICRDAIDMATSFIGAQWDAFKSNSLRKIPTLPRYAYDSDLYLTLPRSGEYLKSVLSQPRHIASARPPAVDLGILDSNSSKATTQFYSSLLKQFCTLEDCERNNELLLTREAPESQDQCSKKCQELAQTIRHYIEIVGDAYEGNPEQMSVFVLNIFELWMHMDQCAVDEHPLLSQYHPFFKPEMLDILLLTRRRDLERLQTIQKYIHTRCRQAKRSMDIFVDPQEGCFADQYFVLGDDLNIMRLNRLRGHIETKSLQAEEAKKRELQKVNAEYEKRTQGTMQHTCTGRRNPDGSHDIHGCTHCWHVRRRRKLKIEVHEEYLPREDTQRNITQQRAILFELDTPETFSSYRRATWEIIHCLCPRTPQVKKKTPEMLLKDYPPLKSYYSRHGGFSLASTTKSFRGTHYNSRYLPAKEDTILLPLGLTFAYYDSGRGIWAKDIQRPLSFAHHFALTLPRGLPFSDLYSSADFAPDTNGPSSYEAIASIPECPLDLTIHEYTAHQNLISGKNRRWLTILMELGSSNVNFSLQDTMLLFHHLSLQVGPRLENDHLRAVHVVFRDYAFCRKLLCQIEQHVEAISQNWRENYYMETLLTLTIRVCTLGHKAAFSEANAILTRIRNVTLSWIKTLRDETRSTPMLDVAERSARYGFLAALLCRRTFYLAGYDDRSLDKESLTAFVEATLAMQENLVFDLSQFSTITKNILIRDIKMTHRLRETIRHSISQHPSSLESAIDTFWPNSAGHAREYTSWECLGAPYEFWVKSTVVATVNTMPQVVHYHLLEGHLLIDGKALGKLPASIRDSEILKNLFGNERLVSFPSNLPGMSYMLSIPKGSYYIHLGYRGKELVIQALNKMERLELIPSHIFENEVGFDLPGSLIDGCVHWLNLWSGNLEVRRKPKIWIQTPGNWILNLGESQAKRKNSYLVNPQSKTFSLISQIFRNFAPARALTVFQPEKGSLSVEIKSLDLIFHVNPKRLLQCQQLASEIDPDQDAGTLYGLKSMIVLRDAKNPSRRSVLTTLGYVRCCRSGVHVEVHMENDGRYAKYSIDPVLGRLNCAPEPRLLYRKALMHALTSFVIPDPLTGRTGTEEALHCLQSGLCKPWNPLIKPLAVLLQSIASLAPQRQYYPENLSRQQKVTWNPNLTMTIQHDAYKGIIDSLMDKSRRLWLFHFNEESTTDDQEPTVRHLHERAHWRRSIYERPEEPQSTISPPFDIVYSPRGNWTQSDTRVTNAREILTLLRQQPGSIRTTRNLKDIMSGWPIIGGYRNEFAPSSITDCLKTDLAQEWGGLVRSQCQPTQTFNAMFQLGLMAFSENVDMRILRTLVAFFLLEDLKKLDLPKCLSVSGRDMDTRPSLIELIDIIRPFCQEYEMPPFPRKKKDREEAQRLYEEACELHEQKCLEESTSFARFLLQQWPTRKPSAEQFDEEFLDKDEALVAISPRWQQLHEALEFSNHISEVQRVLNDHHVKKNESNPIVIPKVNKIYGLRKGPSTVIPRLSYLLSAQEGKALISGKSRQLDNPVLGPKQSLAEAGTQYQNKKAKSTAEITELEKIIAPFVNSDSHVRSSYGRDLARSVDAFKCMSQDVASNFQVDIDLESEILLAQETVNGYERLFRDLFSSEDARFSWLDRANLWPSMGPISMLEQLRSNSNCNLDEGMKHELIGYGTAIAKLQHLSRMRDAVLKDDQTRLRQEKNNPGYINWYPSDYPDWLLFEIDADIHIREDQVIVALEMISPKSGSNSVLQMNMGQGKTSVIMPIVASSLADGELLTRLLVPSALLSQTAEILQSRLGGLVGREITHIPFSRRTPTTEQHIKEYRGLHEEILNRGGIILGIPEHALSFKLCGLQRLSDGKISEAKQMVAIQSWMDQVCRDILDECDFTLATKTQLVYPSGAQLTVDGHPYRWKVTQMILSLVAHNLRDLSVEFPRSVDVIERGISAFPIAHILRNDVEHALIQRIVDDICAGRTSILPIREYTPVEQQAIREFISQEEIEETTAEIVVGLFANAPITRKNVHLLRGLFVHGILLLCLKKRWNVQYGLHPKRDPVAVPFHAKGVPSEQAEWGHPDVAILFTCLAFYYHGLEQRQIRQSLQVVLRSDDPATEYDQWTQTSTTLPDALRHWNLINLADEGQIEKIWLHLRFSTVVVNHFLNHFVFPAHAKQFSIKLQASGWDVPLFSPNGKIPAKGQKRPGITTGFSGTNDNKRLLPLTVEQQDLPRLLHTNAEVLTYLLQKRNREYMLARGKNGKRFSESNLLGYLRLKKIRILIDAGAFILEMDNEALVEEWLRVDFEPQAAVYFGADNKAWVKYRAGAKVPLLATPFADNLNNCLVYLDEAHTRGTDLKLPAEAQAALTLGLNQTKDHTVQAAMRMRQLGTTQSIMFIAPPEVHQSIQDVCKKQANERLDSSNVVTWLLHQTCNNIEELQPLYLSQGKDFCTRMQAATTYKKFLFDRSHQEAFLGVLRQSEQQDLEELYAPKMSNLDLVVPPEDSMGLTGELVAFQKELRARQLHSRSLISSLKSCAFEEVEQEREVAFQVEEEREVQRPRRMPALKFPGLHKTIRNFVKTGLLSGTDGYLKASKALEMTKLRAKYGIGASMLLSQLHISVEFLRTVETKNGKTPENFTRPVNWILWSELAQTALVIIPEEAELVIPLLRAARKPCVHLLLYAAPVTRKMLHFDNLMYYDFPTLPQGWKAPSWLPFELGILAGRLYFNFSDYDGLLEKLCPAGHSDDGDDSYDDDDDYSQSSGSNTKNVLAFLNEWLALRRQGQDITHTPMGYVCHGRHLRRDHPFFMQRSIDLASEQDQRHVRKDEEEDCDDYYESDGQSEGSVDIVT